MRLRQTRTLKRRDYRRTTRLWARCEGCGCKWQWSGLTEYAERVGVATIEASACFCRPWERTDAPEQP